MNLDLLAPQPASPPRTMVRRDWVSAAKSILVLAAGTGFLSVVLNDVGMELSTVLPPAVTAILVGAVKDLLHLWLGTAVAEPHEGDPCHTD